LVSGGRPGKMLAKGKERKGPRRGTPGGGVKIRRTRRSGGGAQGTAVEAKVSGGFFVTVIVPEGKKRGCEEKTVEPKRVSRGRREGITNGRKGVPSRPNARGTVRGGDKQYQAVSGPGRNEVKDHWVLGSRNVGRYHKRGRIGKGSGGVA